MLHLGGCPELQAVGSATGGPGRWPPSELLPGVSAAKHSDSRATLQQWNLRQGVVGQRQDTLSGLPAPALTIWAHCRDNFASGLFPQHACHALGHMFDLLNSNTCKEVKHSKWNCIFLPSHACPALPRPRAPVSGAVRPAPKRTGGVGTVSSETGWCVLKTPELGAMEID